MKQSPILGITMGDVCGIGPEIAVKALLRPETYDICHPIIVGDSRIVERGVRAVGAKGLTVHPVQKVSDALFQPGTLDVYEVPLACENVDEIPYGKVTVIGGEAAFTCVRKVIELAMANKIDGTITGPLNKEAMNLAGYHYNGHTEIYAEFTHTKDYAMMLADEKLRVCPLGSIAGERAARRLDPHARYALRNRAGSDTAAVSQGRRRRFVQRFRCRTGHKHCRIRRENDVSCYAELSAVWKRDAAVGAGDRPVCHRLRRACPI